MTDSQTESLWQQIIEPCKDTPETAPSQPTPEMAMNSISSPQSNPPQPQANLQQDGMVQEQTQGPSSPRTLSSDELLILLRDPQEAIKGHYKFIISKLFL